MREVLFRGKRTDNSEWVYGFYSPLIWYPSLKQTPSIKSFKGGDMEINPETLGQYTGVTDKNGTKIFEDDIVKVRLQNGYLNYRVLFYYGMFRLNSLDDRFYIPIEPYEMEVIGNIYDHNVEDFKNGS